MSTSNTLLQKVQVNIPFCLLFDRYLPMVLEHGINPEIGFTHIDFERFQLQDFCRVADVLLDRGLTVTFHAPFMDLRPGAPDFKVRLVTIDRLQQVFDLASYFQPQCIVCHPSFDDRYYVSMEQDWLDNSIDTWRRFIAQAEEMNTVISLENVYERTPRQLGLLFHALPGQNLFFCFDTGHFNAFSNRRLDSWMQELGRHLGQLHLHDNDGTGDSHLPIGEGNFPFPRLFELLGKESVEPIITLEPHTEENLWKTLANLSEMKLLK
jgi:sugar phosphate isomerase/epimerase